jgi:hypothetical protein
VAAAFVELVLAERDRRAVHRRQRRPQLVGHDRDELVLEPVELAQPIEGCVDPALVEGDREQRPDEDDGDERRAIPEDDEDHRQRGHDQERRRGQEDVVPQGRDEPPAALARDDGGEQRHVDAVPGGRRGDGADDETRERAVVHGGRGAARRDGGADVESAVERGPRQRGPTAGLGERHRQERHDRGGGPAVDRCDGDEEDRRQRGVDGHALDRDRERLRHRRRREQDGHPGDLRPARPARNEEPDGEHEPDRPGHDHRDEDRQEPARVLTHVHQRRLEPAALAGGTKRRVFARAHGAVPGPGCRTPGARDVSHFEYATVSES